jgi:TolA-binding protein
MPLRSIARCCLVALSLAGCNGVAAMSKATIDPPRDTRGETECRIATALQRDVEDLAGQVEAQASVIADLEVAIDALSARLAEAPSRTDVETVARAVSALTARNDEILARLEAHERTMTVHAESTGAGTGPPSPPPHGSEMSSREATAAAPPEPRPSSEQATNDLYQTAYLDFSRGNYALAIGGFREFARRHPENEAADNALYWIGESYFGLAHRYRDAGEVERATVALQAAAEEFREVTKRHPYGDKVPAALYREAIVLMELQQPDAARTRLDLLIKKFPRAPEARRAREHELIQR